MDWGAHPAASGYPGNVRPGGRPASVAGGGGVCFGCDDARHAPTVWSWCAATDADILPLTPTLQAAATVAAAIEAGVGGGPPPPPGRQAQRVRDDWGYAARRLREMDAEHTAAWRQRQQAKAMASTAASGMAMHADASRGGVGGGGGGGGGWGGAARVTPPPPPPAPLPPPPPPLSTYTPGGGEGGWGGGGGGFGHPAGSPRYGGGHPPGTPWRPPAGVPFSWEYYAQLGFPAPPHNAHSPHSQQ